MATIFDKILSLKRQFYPKGRAFKMPYGGYLESLHRGLAVSEERVYNDAVSFLDCLIPDNENFTEQDATDWERRLGLITNDSVPLAQRKEAIIRKMNHPGIVPARQNFRFVQYQLMLAGFAVFVHENRFESGGSYITVSAVDLADTPYENQHGDFDHGDQQHGEYWGNKVANYIEEEKDALFDEGDNLRSTFFIGGEVLGSSADVPVERKNEFRELILRLKPAQTVAYLFINYV